MTIEAASAAGTVLYVHPWGHLNDLVVPAGAITCMNAIPGPKLGRYAFEVTDDEIRGAAVVCIDLHWALALSGLEPLARHVRAVAPGVPIVVGGISAAHLTDELLAALPIDYVIRGDAEASFAALCAALRAGRAPPPLPNVHRRGVPPPEARRMTDAEFDATDPVTIDWFPTLSDVTDLDAAAFPPGRTICVTRGCPMRCPTCYGSHASTFGVGHLWRTPERAAELLERTALLGARNVRLVIGKPSSVRLSALVRGLAARGPYHFASEVGLFLCRAPSDEDLDLLEHAFASPLTLSAVPPDEHAPALAPDRLEAERAEWLRVAARVARSRVLHLDVWAASGRPLEPLRRSLGADARAEPGRPRISVSSAAVWSMTRPGDGETTTLADVRAAVAPVWSFYAARLLSPALAHLLAPFRFLDEVEHGLDQLPPPAADALVPFFEAIRGAWRAHRIPMLPDLAFDAVPVALRDGALGRAAEGTRYHGDVGVCARGGARVQGPATPLTLELDHRGVALRGRLDELPPAGVALALVPRGARPTTEPWLEAMSERGLVVLRARMPTAPPALELRIDLRVQDARVFLLDDRAETLARGVADLAYFRARRAPAPPRLARPS